MVLHPIPQASCPSHRPEEGGILIFLATPGIFSSTSGIARSLRPNFEGLLTTPSSQKCFSLPSQHHLADSQSRPLHSVRREAAALGVASWSHSPPQLGLRAGRRPRRAVPSRRTARSPRPQPSRLRTAGAARIRRRVGGRTGGASAKVGGEPRRGRAVTPPDLFPRSRQDTALDPFQSALTALGIFQGRSLESCGCVVQDSRAGSRPQMALPSVLQAVPGTRLRFPHLTEGKMGGQLKLNFR